MVVKADPVLPGIATGVVLRSTRPLSFWGGVDAASGRIADPESEHLGVALAGRVLMLAATRGSSSSSSVLLELVAAGNGPAAIVLGEVDAILGIGILVARELGHRGPPLLRLDPARQEAFATGDLVAVAEDGEITRVHGAAGAGGPGAAEGPAQLRLRLARLREEHRDLDDAIARLSADALHDQLRLQRLKKRKLALKDQVQRLEAMLVPDIIA